MNDDLRNDLLLTAVESSISLIRREAAKIQGCVETVVVIRKHNPVNTPCADLRISAEALRATALELENLAMDAEL